MDHPQITLTITETLLLGNLPEGLDVKRYREALEASYRSVASQYLPVDQVTVTVDVQNASGYTRGPDWYYSGSDDPGDNYPGNDLGFLLSQARDHLWDECGSDPRYYTAAEG
ncbi:MAG: hypothetical protein U0974_15735 [Gemmatimonadales bacterium]|nr:hypothetical protein [Gemmatimonadales bacterium]